MVKGYPGPTVAKIKKKKPILKLVSKEDLAKQMAAEIIEADGQKVHKFTVPEIARKVGLSESAVRKNIARTEDEKYRLMAHRNQLNKGFITLEIAQMIKRYANTAIGYERGTGRSLSNRKLNIKEITVLVDEELTIRQLKKLYGLKLTGKIINEANSIQFSKDLSPLDRRKEVIEIMKTKIPNKFQTVSKRSIRDFLLKSGLRTREESQVIRKEHPIPTAKDLTIAKKLLLEPDRMSIEKIHDHVQEHGDGSMSLNYLYEIYNKLKKELGLKRIYKFKPAPNILNLSNKEIGEILEERLKIIFMKTSQFGILNEKGTRLFGKEREQKIRNILLDWFLKRMNKFNVKRSNLITFLINESRFAIRKYNYRIRKKQRAYEVSYDDILEIHELYGTKVNKKLFSEWLERIIEKLYFEGIEIKLPKNLTPRQKFVFETYLEMIKENFEKTGDIIAPKNEEIAKRVAQKTGEEPRGEHGMSYLINAVRKKIIKILKAKGQI
jgi:hypothetical protein